MKKYLGILTCLFFITCFFMTEKVEATDEMKSEVSITLSLQEMLPLDPVKDNGLIQQNYQGKLPSTGDLIDSLIYTILGFSLLLVFVGAFLLKNILLNIAWE